MIVKLQWTVLFASTFSQFDIFLYKVPSVVKMWGTNKEKKLELQEKEFFCVCYIYTNISNFTTFTHKCYNFVTLLFTKECFLDRVCSH